MRSADDKAARWREAQGLIESCVKPIDIQPPEHTKLRGNRRILAEELQAAVRARDAGQMQLCISRLSRLGVKRDVIEQLALEAHNGLPTPRSS